LEFGGSASTVAANAEAAAYLSPTKGDIRPINRCSSCRLFSETLLNVAKKGLASDSSLLDALLEDQDGELSPSKSALLIMRSCLFIIHSHITSSVLEDRLSSSVSLRALARRVKDESGKKTDWMKMKVPEIKILTRPKAMMASVARTKSGRITSSGANAGWSPLDEKRLKSYMKE
jgi:hypothetical protein